ncbi:MAG: prenyltransferase/squalene oxidase repeat-containing protein, partial [Planctomycetaceae bacterium]
ERPLDVQLAPPRTPPTPADRRSEPRADASAVVAAPRPREVALLERLASSSQPRRSTDSIAPLAVAASAPARSTTVASGITGQVATSEAAPATVAETVSPQPTARPLARPLATQPLAAPVMGRAAAAVQAGDAATESAVGGGRSAADPLAAAPAAPLGRAAAPATAGIDASVAAIAPSIGVAAAGAAAATGSTQSAVADGLAALAPAAVGRGAGGLAAARDAESGVTRGGTAVPADGDEELSAAEPADAAAAAPLGPAAVPLDRVASVSLPAEGRVRDVSEAFARRAPDKRADRRAGSPGDEAAATAERADAIVARGLEFLVRSQQADGRWSLGRFAGGTAADVPKLESETAATGLALLCFLGAGHDHFDGPYRDTVRRGLESLIAAQKPDGDLYVPADELSNSCAWLYSHGIAAMALCEAVGMTGDARVKPAATQACRFIAASQHPDRGGWRYTPRSDADLSVSGWMLVALRAGSLAGLDTEPRALSGVRTLLDAAVVPGDPARSLYNPRNPQQRPSRLSSACMTAVGAVMRLHTGAQPADPKVMAAARALTSVPAAYGSATDKTRDAYLWYYASQVLVHTGGPDWDRWYRGLVGTLASTQDTAGAKSGSWDPLGPQPDRWGPFGGRLYVTALHLLALEVPYRHLPTYTAAR